MPARRMCCWPWWGDHRARHGWQVGTSSVVVAALAGLASASASAAQEARFALIVQGASGEEQYAVLHRKWTTDRATLPRDRFCYPSGQRHRAGQQPGAGETH